MSARTRRECHACPRELFSVGAPVAIGGNGHCARPTQPQSASDRQGDKPEMMSQRHGLPVGCQDSMQLASTTGYFRQDTFGAIQEIEHIRGLGFIGLMVRGSHHQPHHLAMAKAQFD